MKLVVKHLLYTTILDTFNFFFLFVSVIPEDFFGLSFGFYTS